MFQGLLVMVVVAGALVAIAALFAFLTTGSDTEDRRGVRLVGLASLVIAVGFGALAIFSAVSTLVPGTPVAVTIPVETVAIEPHPGVTFLDGPAAHIASGGFTSAEVTSTDLGLGTRLFLAAGGLLTAAVVVMIAIVVTVVCRRLLAGRPFASAVTRLAFATALVALIAGFAGQVLEGIGSSQAAQELLFIGGAALEDAPAGTDDTGFPTARFLVEIEFWPIAVAFILGVFATLVRFGGAVERQRDDLETEAIDLRRDADGLI